MKKKYKVLMYGPIFVDGNRLNSGIYESDKPFLYSTAYDLEDLVEIRKGMEEYLPEGYSDKEAIERLKMCKLVECEITLNF
jgi:hypothetical protein